MLAVALARYAQSLPVTGADGTSTSLTAPQIAALPHLTINPKDHDTPAQFDGVPLPEILTLARLETGKKEGPQMTPVLLIEAAEGYKVVCGKVTRSI